MVDYRTTRQSPNRKITKKNVTLTRGGGGRQGRREGRVGREEGEKQKRAKERSGGREGVVGVRKGVVGGGKEGE